MNKRAQKNPIGMQPRKVNVLGRDNAADRRPQKISRNLEGAKAFVDRADRTLYNIASQFKFRNGGYLTDVDKLKNLENAVAENLRNGDKDFVFAVAWFLGAVNGIRLSPTILLTQLALNKNISADDKKSVAMIINEVYTRPDFISTTAAYYKMVTGKKSFAGMPLYLKNLLRRKLSTYSAATLKKRKMKSRDIKLADLIKVLKPVPKNADMSKLYKAIIENDRHASLQVVKDETGKVVKADSLVAVVSSDNVAKIDKQDYIVKNLSTIAINELIRNMTFVPQKVYGRLERRLIDALSSSQAFRYVNPFDLVLMSLAHFNTGGTPELRRILDKVLMKTICNNISFNAKNPMLVVDISGSMKFDRGPRAEKSILYVIKYLSLLLPILIKDNSNIQFYNFDYSLQNFNRGFEQLFEEGEYTPNVIAERLIGYYNGAVGGGTALRDCTYQAISRHPECDCLLIFTDEVSWADKKTVDSYRELIPPHLKYKTFVFNVLPEKHTMFSQEDEITRISGIDGNGLYLMNALMDFTSFKQNIISMYQEQKNARNK